MRLFPVVFINIIIFIIIISDTIITIICSYCWLKLAAELFYLLFLLTGAAGPDSRFCVCLRL